MNRETKELTTPGGHTVVVKGYLTTGEMLPILKSAIPNPTTADNIDKGLKTIEAAVVSIDNVSDNVLEVLNDLPVGDYMFILQEVAKLADFRTTKSSPGTNSSS